MDLVLRLVHRLCPRKMKTSIAALPFLILAAQAARGEFSEPSPWWAGGW